MWVVGVLGRNVMGDNSNLITVVMYIVGLILGSLVSWYIGNPTWLVILHGIPWPMFFASFIWNGRF